MSIEVKNLTHIYMKNTPYEKRAIDDVSLKIDDGDFIAIIGHTGSGKSTLIQHLNGLLTPESGQIMVSGVDINSSKASLLDVRKKVGLVFQYPEYQLFEETVSKDIAFGPTNLGLSKDEIQDRVVKSMQMVGLDYEKYKDLSPFELSGGQKRRVAIAGVIAMEPDVLILDEPTAALDPKGRDDILTQIKKLHDDYSMTIILVSHSMEDVAKIAEKVIVMDKGKIALQGDVGYVFSKAQTLENIGLAVPQITYLMIELKKRGFPVSDNVFTVKQAKEELIKVLRRGQDD